ncbi:MAG TPA: NAD-dependent epimerase/dehydratase family protein [Syntrophomonadaceae bacterium]|nr:NAD-dependent epimerase/dehydratase family protein [Syntrophomonadaceae bacterium]
MRTLVVGGAGFIGSHLCDALIANGNFVISLDNLSRGCMANIEHLIDNKNFIFLEKDAGCSINMAEVFEQFNPEYIYHLAANSDIQASAKDPQVEYDNTMRTTWVLLDSMRKFGVKKMFFASTSAVYGQQCGIPLNEDTTLLMPISYYGSAKMASEAYISAFAHMNDLSVLVFRFPNVVGTRLTHGVIYDFIKKLRDNPNQLEVLGDGTQSKPYMHVSDLIKGIIQLSDTPQGVSNYNIGVDSETNVKHIANIVCDIMNLKNVQIKYGTESIGWKGDVPRFEYDLNKVAATGWRASMTSDEAVLRTVKEVLAICRA